MDKTITKQIEQVGLFAGLSSSQRERLADISLVRSCSRGQALFSEGDRADSLYIVLEGRVKIFKLSLEGKEQILHIVDAGEPFGEVALFSGISLPAYAEAHSDCRLLVVPREALMAVIREDPSVAFSMLSVLSMRLRRFVNLIEGLSLREVPGRLASYLLFLSSRHDGKDDFKLDMSKGHLASFLGTTPETLSRILGRMEAADIIRGRGSRITIVDRSQLTALAEGESKLP